MRAFLYVGGEIHPDRITEHPRGDDMIIAADGGYRNARTLGERPQFLLGDLDSFGDGELPRDAEVYQVPAEKDLTDTQLAVDFALSRGARELVIVGGLSGRLDHTLSNLSILERLHAMRVPAVITDGQNRVRFLRNDSTLLARGAYPYISLIAADPVVKGVCVDGCKYPLKKAVLRRHNQYAVSNEITGNCALISVRAGGVYIVESADPT